MTMHKTADSLRTTLFEELESLRAGKTTPIRAKAVAGLAVSILKSVEVEMAYREQAVRFNGKDVPQIGEFILSVDGPAPDIPAIAPKPQFQVGDKIKNAAGIVAEVLTMAYDGEASLRLESGKFITLGPQLLKQYSKVSVE